jgi:hypothetical protein
MTVDSHIHFTHQVDNSSSKIRCELEAPVKPQKKKEDTGF